MTINNLPPTICVIRNSRIKLPKRFYKLLEHKLAGVSLDGVQAVTLNLRDPSYSEEQGGYHPVEVRLDREGDSWVLCYVTDFAYAGGELAKEIDVCFVSELVFNTYTGTMPLSRVKPFVRTFIENVADYYHMGVYQVELTTS